MKETKTDKVLRRLTGAGLQGIHSFDLVTTGGLRYAARVFDLKNEGYLIVSRPEKKNKVMGCRYFLLKNKNQIKQLYK